MSIKLFTIEDKEWDNIVAYFKEADIYYYRSYVRAFQIHGDGDPSLIYYKSGNVQAINVAMKREIILDGLEEKLYDLSTPYGYGGLLFDKKIEQNDMEKFNREYVEFCKENKIVSEFVRFHPVNKNSLDCKKIYDVINLGKTVTMDLSSEEFIWSNIHSKNRNMIRKAQKNGIEIFCGRSPELFEKFRLMYNKTMEKDNAADYYYFSPEFYKSILNDLKNSALIFYAEQEGKIIAMSIILYSKGQLHYHLSASDIEYRNLAPTNLLLFDVAIWGSVNGYKTFHLGGGVGSHEDNLYKFKKSFYKGEDTQFSIGRKIFDAEKYKMLCNIRFKGETYDNVSFFPQYRY